MKKNWLLHVLSKKALLSLIVTSTISCAPSESTDLLSQESETLIYKTVQSANDELSAQELQILANLLYFSCIAIEWEIRARQTAHYHYELAREIWLRASNNQFIADSFLEDMAKKATAVYHQTSKARDCRSAVMQVASFKPRLKPLVNEILNQLNSEIITLLARCGATSSLEQAHHLCEESLHQIKAAIKAYQQCAQPLQEIQEEQHDIMVEMNAAQTELMKGEEWCWETIQQMNVIHFESWFALIRLAHTLFARYYKLLYNQIHANNLREKYTMIMFDEEGLIPESEYCTPLPDPATLATLIPASDNAETSSTTNEHNSSS